MHRSLDTYGPLIIADGALVYLRMDEASGTVASDSSGNGRNGTYASSGVIMKSAPIRAGSNGSLNITALSGGATVPSDAALTFATVANSTFSVEICMMGSPGGGSAQTSLIGRWISAGAGTIQWYMSVTTHTSAQIRARCYTGTQIIAGGAAGSGDGSAVHYVFTSDGTNCRLYANGTQYGPATAVTSPTAASTNPICIGGFGTGFPSSYGFIGSVSDVAIYDYALDATTVLAHAHAGGFA